MTRAILVAGALACALDAYTTWAALHVGHSFTEGSPATAGLIASFGLAGGLLLSAAIRVALFGGLCVTMRLVRWEPAVVALGLIGIVGVAYTWFIALTNITTLASG